MVGHHHQCLVCYSENNLICNVSVSVSYFSFLAEICKLAVAARGGVEDTRLEAKDTKKIRGQGQGQPFRGQTLSRPRPRTQAQVLSKEKKRSSQKFFRRSPKKKKVFTKIQRFPNNFSSASQNFNNSKNSAVLEPRTGQFSGT